MASTIALDEDEWRALADAHRKRVEPWVAPRRERRQTGASHPVDDFLFDYYPYSLAKLSTWHPGHRVVLRGAADAFLANPAYVRVENGITANIAHLARSRPRLRMVLRLLDQTAARPPQLGCFGLHEWAMVHGLDADQVRHASTPLRLPPAEIEQVLDEIGLRCTHIDAYRFFTPTAIPLNAHRPTRSAQHEWDQPGCLHANMDLYKYAMWFLPHVSSDLVADCFELARSARELDMRAAPYDLADLGYQPITIETVDGRREYADEQRQVSDAAAPLRAQLLAALRILDDEVRRSPR